MRLKVVAGRAAVLVLCTAFGIGLGLLGDFVVGDLNVPSWHYTGRALALSPVVVALGGMGVTIPAMGFVFLVGGILFWPVYATVVWLWFRRPSMWMPVFFVIWTAQGYFQFLHRLEVFMSA